MKWYIGQEIVCIKTHEQGVVKKGQTYIIKSLQLSKCKCNDVDIDIGIVSNNRIISCPICGWVDNKKTNVHWLTEKLFAPIDFDISELTDILEQPKELINK